jgi:hypothetical protein
VTGWLRFTEHPDLCYDCGMMRGADCGRLFVAQYIVEISEGGTSERGSSPTTQSETSRRIVP